MKTISVRSISFQIIRYIKTVSILIVDTTEESFSVKLCVFAEPPVCSHVKLIHLKNPSKRTDVTDFSLLF